MGRNSLRIMIFALAATALALSGTTAASAEQQSFIPQSEVTKRDARGRVQVMETRTSRGTCMAEITYTELPRIYVVVISRTRLQNLGYLQINNGTEGNLTNEVLMENFHKAISEHCLPLIVPEYVRS